MRSVPGRRGVAADLLEGGELLPLSVDVVLVHFVCHEHQPLLLTELHHICLVLLGEDSACMRPTIRCQSSRNTLHAFVCQALEPAGPPQHQILSDRHKALPLPFTNHTIWAFDDCSTYLGGANLYDLLDATCGIAGVDDYQASHILAFALSLQQHSATSHGRILKEAMRIASYTPVFSSIKSTHHGN